MNLMGKKTFRDQEKETYTALLCRLALILVIGYIAAVVLLYFLAEEQLHPRQSRGNLELPAADSGTVELGVAAWWNSVSLKGCMKRKLFLVL